MITYIQPSWRNTNVPTDLRRQTLIPVEHSIVEPQFVDLLVVTPRLSFISDVQQLNNFPQETIIKDERYGYHKI